MVEGPRASHSDNPAHYAIDILQHITRRLRKTLFLPWALLLLGVLALPASATDAPKRRPVKAMSEAEIDRLIKNPPAIAVARLPRGYKIGRCLLIVDGKTRIAGTCAYRITKGGEISIEGPRQIYDGIDYPDANGSLALLMSTDFWASIFRDDDGSWNGYGNDDISGVNGAGPKFGSLRHDGACFLNERVRACLWKK